jgi:cytochrome c oxidase accessory protein FixG
MSNKEKNSESFRDSIGTLTKEGKRNWIFAQKPSGMYHKARAVVATILLAFLFAGPFITINGHPILQLNVLERKFTILGMVFWPSDFYILVLAALTLLLFVIVFTSIFGRIWCGWACPQTIFMEMVFRKIEYWIEGDASAQKRLNREPWSAKKIFKKISKHGIFYAVSFIIANTFLAYIIGKDALFKIMSDPVSAHLSGFIIINIFSLVFYGVFSRFREQVCQFACPYGRYQSVMIDEDSIAVTYDFERGEPRGNPKKAKRSLLKKKNKAKEKVINAGNHGVNVADIAQSGKIDSSEIPELGDCIDCYQCVKICPAGIDIRNGIQMECIQCTACMDACDNVMDKIDKPRGLIRYSSWNGILNHDKKIRFTPRVMAYTIVLLILATLFTGLLFSRSDTQSIILRAPGVLYQQLPNGNYTNIYNLKLINKTFDEKKIALKLLNPDKGSITVIGKLEPVPPQEIREGRFFVALPKSAMKPELTQIVIGVYTDGKLSDKIQSSFIGPDKLNP